MVKIALRIKATLENIEEFKPSGAEFSWCLKFCCTNCAEVSEKWNDVSLSEEFTEQHGKAVCHFFSKCKMCSRCNSIAIIKDSVGSYTAKDEGTFKNIVVLDCRGMEPVEFLPKDGWVAEASDGGDTFNEVDFKDGDWVDYCETTKRPVSIGEIEYEFVRTK